jgi:hypothetical protein
MRSGTSAVRGPRDGGGVMRLNPISQWTSTWRRQGCPRGGVAEATHSAWQRAVYERNEGGHPRRWWRNEPGTRLRDGLRRGVAMAVLAGDVAEATLRVRATITVRAQMRAATREDPYAQWTSTWRRQGLPSRRMSLKPRTRCVQQTPSERNEGGHPRSFAACVPPRRGGTRVFSSTRGTVWSGSLLVSSALGRQMAEQGARARGFLRFAEGRASALGVTLARGRVFLRLAEETPAVGDLRSAIGDRRSAVGGRRWA